MVRGGTRRLDLHDFDIAFAVGVTFLGVSTLEAVSEGPRGAARLHELGESSDLLQIARVQGLGDLLELLAQKVRARLRLPLKRSCEMGCTSLRGSPAQAVRATGRKP